MYESIIKGKMRAVMKGLSYIAGIIIVIFLLYKYVFFVIIVPSPSMYPTIDVGDRILTTRIHNTSSIKRGDVLVFYSDEFQEVMVKRVIGLPNEKIEIDSKGEVFVNNQRLNESYVKYPDDLSGTFEVPDGEYFFLGDFRDHSYDSRKWKDPFIPKSMIMGQAKIILFPFQRIGFIN